MSERLNYNEIIEYMCLYYDITPDEMIRLLKKKEYKYMLLLLLKKHDCVNIDILKKRFELKEGKIIKNNIRYAEEMLLFNAFFREKYFNMENYIEKNFSNDKKTLDISKKM
ncbi:MAG: hypothetical protein Q4F66_06605 [Clostridium sp.]|nr:hypothetical protein [Clostridium sp.]